MCIKHIRLRVKDLTYFFIKFQTFWQVEKQQQLIKIIIKKRHLKIN